MKLATVDEMRQLEEAAVNAGETFPGLMETAGLATAREAWMMLGATPGQDVVVLAGPGNNGGDGLVAARHLHDWGSRVTVFATTARTQDANALALSEREVPVFDPSKASAMLERSLLDAQLVVDALLGTGRSRPIDPSTALGRCLAATRAARSSPDGPRLLAVDVPSGLNADTGEVDPMTVAADLTVTFGLAKVGLYQHPGAAMTGAIEVAPIGIPAEAERVVRQALLSSREVGEALPPRRLDGNKGTFGRVLVIGGCRRFTGAVVLAGRAAYRSGAGLVTIACPAPVHQLIAGSLSEATWLPQDATDEGALAETVAISLRPMWSGFSAAVVGPGMGDAESTRALAWAALPDAAGLRGLVVDADALNAVATFPEGDNRVPPNAVLTPHPGEMARLLGVSVAQVQSDRLGAAREAATRFGCTVVLKGAGTVIAHPNGTASVAPFSNPLLATAGTGDVLAGCIAGLMAQGLEPHTAANAGVYLHGIAGEQLAGKYGTAGLLAGELADALPLAIRELRE